MSSDEPPPKTTTNTHTKKKNPTRTASPWQTQSVFEEFAQVCAPVKYQHTLGKNITLNQADVEWKQLRKKLTHNFTDNEIPGHEDRL